MRSPALDCGGGRQSHWTAVLPGRLSLPSDHLFETRIACLYSLISLPRFIRTTVRLGESVPSGKVRKGQPAGRAQRTPSSLASALSRPRPLARATTKRQQHQITHNIPRYLFTRPSSHSPAHSALAPGRRSFLFLPPASITYSIPCQPPSSDHDTQDGTRLPKDDAPVGRDLACSRPDVSV